MRLATVDGRLAVCGAGGPVDVWESSGGRFGPDPMTVFDRWDEFVDWSGSVDPASVGPVAAGTLGAPAPRPRQVFAVALNYPPHAAEAGFEPPREPLVFTKFPSCIVGPEATVELPGDHVDWEVELVAVIGRRAHRVAEGDAWSYVAGLTVGQDLSERRVQLAGSPPQFSLGKSYPGFGPTGPVLVTPDEFPDPDDLEITCSLGDTVLQHSRTTTMIFSVPALVAYLSSICPLYPGDLVFTGTPAGVGNRMKPQRFLRAGETLTSRIEGIGEIRTHFTKGGAGSGPN